MIIVNDQFGNWLIIEKKYDSKVSLFIEPSQLDYNQLDNGSLENQTCTNLIINLLIYE